MPSSAANPLPLLYSYRRCPYAMRARMALLQARRNVQVVEISLRDKPAAMLALSPKGTVPVLHLPDGRVFDESWDIMRWAFLSQGDDELRDDAAGWWARAQAPENLALLQRNDGDFKHHLDRTKYPERYGGDARSRDAHRSLAVLALLGPLEARLQAQPYLGGSSPCATDLALVPFVRQFAAVDPGWWGVQPLPMVRAWLTSWLSGSLFARCMAKPTPITPAQAVRTQPPFGRAGEPR
jgi:glutathione S-transferase